MLDNVNACLGLLRSVEASQGRTRSKFMEMNKSKCVPRSVSEFKSAKDEVR